MSDGLNIGTHIRAHATERPDQPALRYPSASYSDAKPAWDSLTFAELDERSDAYARGFVANGVRQGDRVLMLMKPQLDLWVVLFALFKLGAVPVVIDPGMGRKRLMDCIERTACRVILAEAAVHAARTLVFRRPFAAAEVFITVGRRWWWGGVTLDACLVADERPFEIVRVPEEDEALVAFTSGSTGTPKGVVYHQGMTETAIQSIRSMLGVKAGDTAVETFAAFALYDLCWGHTTVIPKIDLSKPATADPAALVAAIQENQAQCAFASPIIWRKLAPYCLENDIQLHSLDRAYTAGAPIPPEMIRQYADILRDGVEFHTPYGATEAIPVSHISSGELIGECIAQTARGAGTCVGHPAPGAQIRIIQVTDDPIPTWSDDLLLPQGAIGEVVVGGRQVSRRYDQAPEGNAEAKIADGDQVLHRMGDLGYLDGEGRLWFCGRKSHRLQTASGMLPAVPVEGVFNEHGSVFRSALVGTGEAGAQVPALCIELMEGSSWSADDEAALLALATGTPYDGVVQTVLVHPAFPTDARHNSKIRRGDLREWAQQQA